MNGDVALFLWLMLALKIPLGALLWLVWWAAKAPEPEVDEDTGGGNDRRHGRDGSPPKPPRRGPHGDPLPLPPERVRVAKGRSVKHGAARDQG